MPTDRPHLVWFRDDLRLDDNPALVHAAASDAPVLALYVLDEISEGIRPVGSASRWWLHGSLENLGAALERLGVKLLLRRGPAADIVADVARETHAGAVSWNRRCGEAERRIDAALETTLTDAGIATSHFKANLLFEPNEVRSGSGEPYRVFSAFWRAANKNFVIEPPLAAPAQMTGWTGTVQTDALNDWRLRPVTPDWAEGLRKNWQPGEDGARKRLATFLGNGLTDYAQGRDFPERDTTSKLSPHLRFGEMSPRRIHHDVEARTDGADTAKFLSELGWREFSHQLLGNFPDIATRNFNARFDDFPWRDDGGALSRWQRGQTGYPIVDAGMRELWATGTMHNRVRMIVASFLTKHLMLHWREGEAWFWDTLVDADPANNPASWQWVAGSGADAAPYFRIFNPILQGEKFDPDGAYTRRWVPELADVPDKYLQKPWQMPPLELAAAGVRLGETYPEPIADHAKARQRALDAYRDMKETGD